MSKANDFLKMFGFVEGMNRSMMDNAEVAAEARRNLARAEAAEKS